MTAVTCHFLPSIRGMHQSCGTSHGLPLRCVPTCQFNSVLSVLFHLLRLSLRLLSSIDLFLFYRTDYTDSQTMLNGCTGVLD